ncbi:unnamed protein product [Eruca vesicaria subsp. sativa]|uniref:Protein kinase domain-containing protein n=1 Tax=Eruca vesicaria subsp. sativa TaxID=29727 RepID=A0ABC8JXA9_ERUVS|nr:unnamed protein product [Eruca vesicaria subsp. sativa]
MSVFNYVIGRGLRYLSPPRSAPELLLGDTEYGPAIDMWSAGCILAELFAGTPILARCTDVEQMHKIFKLCVSPSEDFGEKKLRHLQQILNQVILISHFPASAMTLINKLLAIEPEKRGPAASALRSKFFTTGPLPTNPSNLPRYPQSKNLTLSFATKKQENKACSSKGMVKREVTRGRGKDLKTAQTPEFIAARQSKVMCISHKFKTDEECGTCFTIEPLRKGIQQYNGSPKCC